jgi:hypothetical protein
VADVLNTEPLVLAGLGIAVGAAIGAFLPGTDVEDRYLGETRDRLRDEAEEFAREKFEQGKAVAGEAFRTAKEEADAQGLTSTGEESIVGKVGQVARSTMEKVRESAAEKGLMGSETGGGSQSGSSLDQAAWAHRRERAADQPAQDQPARDRPAADRRAGGSTRTCNASDRHGKGRALHALFSFRKARLLSSGSPVEARFRHLAQLQVSRLLFVEGALEN